MFRPWHILKILSGNQTWQWKIPYSINDINGGIHGKIIDEWGNVRCHV